jgi:hypothetical protein
MIIDSGRGGSRAAELRERLCRGSSAAELRERLCGG